MSRNRLFVAAGLGLAAIVVAVFAARNSMDHGMMEPEMVSGGAGSDMVTITLPETLSANAQMGKRFFDVKCAACHGSNAVGQAGVAPPLIHKIYEPSHHGDFAFLRAAQNGVRAHHWNFGDMPAVEGITAGEVKQITVYIRELQRANGIN